MILPTRIPDFPRAAARPAAGAAARTADPATAPTSDADELPTAPLPTPPPPFLGSAAPSAAPRRPQSPLTLLAVRGGIKVRL